MSRTRRAFTLSQMLVLLALLLLVLGFLLAAVQRTRQAAERAASQNNLKQMCLGTIKTADDNNGLMPPGPEGFYPVNRAVNGGGYGSCLFHILPNIEQGALYRSTALQVKDVNNFHAGWQAAGKPVNTYHLRADPTLDPTSDGTSYLANELAIPAMSVRFPAFYTDGTSNTIFYAEAYSQATDSITWGGKPQTWKVERRWWENPSWVAVPGTQMFQAAPPRDSASSRIPQGFLPAGIVVGLADGSVRLVSERISATTFYYACTPNGGEVLGNDW